MTREQRQRLIQAHRIDMAPNVRRFTTARPGPVKVDYAPPPPKRSVYVDVAGSAFVLVVLVIATFGLLWLPGAR